MSTTQGYTITTNIWSCNIYTLIGYMQIPNKEMCDRPDLMKITDDWKSVIEYQDFTRHADCFTIFTRLVLPHSLLQILPGRQYSMQKKFFWKVSITKFQNTWWWSTISVDHLSSTLVNKKLTSKSQKYYPRNEWESMDHPQLHLFQGHKNHWWSWSKGYIAFLET